MAIPKMDVFPIRRTWPSDACHPLPEAALFVSLRLVAVLLTTQLGSSAVKSVHNPISVTLVCHCAGAISIVLHVFANAGPHRNVAVPVARIIIPPPGPVSPTAQFCPLQSIEPVAATVAAGAIVVGTTSVVLDVLSSHAVKPARTTRTSMARCIVRLGNIELIE